MYKSGKIVSLFTNKICIIHPRSRKPPHCVSCPLRWQLLVLKGHVRNKETSTLGIYYCPWDGIFPQESVPII
ncbi:hypothetical protein XENTR_v10013017 [Xenopus tropicalis]|nr:hypothetical protein XENTR_v10013017 [Xenopus tropicalis]